MTLLLLPTVVLAQQEMPRFEITPFVGYRVGGTFIDSVSDAEIELEEGNGFGISLNIRADSNSQYEITFSHQDTEFDLGSLATGTGTTNLDVAVDYLQLGGTYVGDGRLARPYLVATIGLSRVDPDNAAFNAETYFAFSIGGGVRLWPTERFGLRLEGRFYGSFVDSDTSVFCVSSGGATCLIQSSSDVLWQWEMTVGPSWRF